MLNTERAHTEESTMTTHNQDATYTTGPVTIDGFVTVLAQYDPTVRWNGWLAAPRMDALSVVTVLNALDAEYPDDQRSIYGYDWTFGEDGALLLTDRQMRAEYPDENPTETIPADEDGLYTLGAYGWVWHEDDDPTTSDVNGLPFATHTVGPVWIPTPDDDMTGTTVLGQYDTSVRWGGGFVHPSLDAHSVVTVLQNGTEDWYRWSFTDDGVLTITETAMVDDEEEYRITPDADGLYPMPGWTWESVDDADAALSNPLDCITVGDVVWTWRGWVDPVNGLTVAAVGVNDEDSAWFVDASTATTRDNLRAAIRAFHVEYGDACEVCGEPVDMGDEPGAVFASGRAVDVCSVACTRAALDADPDAAVI